MSEFISGYYWVCLPDTLSRAVGIDDDEPSWQEPMIGFIDNDTIQFVGDEKHYDIDEILIVVRLEPPPPEDWGAVSAVKLSSKN